MSRELLSKVYLDVRALAGVMKGQEDHRKQVVMTCDPTGNITGNGYVHFEKESGTVRVSEKGRVAINVRAKGAKELLCRIHVGVAALSAALKGEDETAKRKQVLMFAAPGGEILGNGYVDFDRETGKPHFSKSGKVLINVRSTKTWSETATQELDDLLPATTAPATQSDLPMGITDADIEAFVDGEMAKLA